MKIHTCLGLLVAAMLVAACGASDGSFVADGAGGGAAATLDQALQKAMADAGVDVVTPPLTDDPALVALGKALFFDKLLSGNGVISCATCHHPVAATGDALPLSLGEGGIGLGANRVPGTGEVIPRNAPHVFNGGVPGMDTMFWDGRVHRDPLTGVLQTPESALNGMTPARADHALPLTSALAAQAMFPVTSHDEMRGQVGTNEIADAADNLEVWQRLMARLVGTSDGTVGGIEAYRVMFRAAFPAVVSFDDYTFGHAASAIAAFERDAFTALDTPLDRYMAGDDSALSDAAKRGAILFCGAAGCADCHSGPLLTDLEHHSLAVPQLGPGKETSTDDRGLALLTLDPADDYKFRTPPLRNVALTGPWMHDGAFTTLAAAVRHHLDPWNGLANYDASQLPALFEPTVDDDAGRNADRTASVSPLIPAPIGLTDLEFADLMAFLHALTDPSSLDLLNDIPDSVPSGLPVQD